MNTVLQKNNMLNIQSLFYRNLLARVGVFYCFMLEGVYMGVWGRYLPNIQDHINLSDSLLGTSVLFVYLGTVIVGPLVACLLQRFGSKTTVILGAWTFIIALPIIAIPDNFAFLTCVMFNYGLCMGIMDISMNNCAILTEIVAGKPLLGSFHGSYSVAAALGSLIGGLYIEFGLSTVVAFISTAIVAFALSALTSMHLYNREQEFTLTDYHDHKGGSDGDHLTKTLLHGHDDEETTNILYYHDERPTLTDRYNANEPTGNNVINSHHSYQQSARNTSNTGKTITLSHFEDELNRPTETQFVTADMLFNDEFKDQQQADATDENQENERRRLSHISDTSLPPALSQQEEYSGFSWDGLYKARKIIAYFSAVGFLAAFGESGIVTWSVVFFERSIPSSTVVKSLGLTSFMVCMAIGRFCSDYLRSIFGRQKIIRVGGILAMIGLCVVVLSVDTPIPALFACFGFAITGLGLSTIIPIVFSSAGHLPDVHAGTAIATVATASYSGSIVASPLIGVISDAFGSLRFALLVDAVLLGFIFPLSWGIIQETTVFKNNHIP